MASRLKKRNPELQFLKDRFRPSPPGGVSTHSQPSPRSGSQLRTSAHDLSNPSEDQSGLSTLKDQLRSLTRKLENLRSKNSKVTKKSSHVHADLANVRRHAIREMRHQEAAFKAKLVEKYSEVLSAELNLVDDLALQDVGNERIKRNAKTLRRNIVKNRVMIELEKKKVKELVSCLGMRAPASFANVRFQQTHTHDLLAARTSNVHLAGAGQSACERTQKVDKEQEAGREREANAEGFLEIAIAAKGDHEPAGVVQDATHDNFEALSLFLFSMSLYIA